MTQTEYKVLQAWCKRDLNRRAHPEEYAEKVKIRNEATVIKRQINHYQRVIEKAAFVLASCTTQIAISKWTNIINENRIYLNNFRKQFKDLPTYESTHTKGGATGF